MPFHYNDPLQALLQSGKNRIRQIPGDSGVNSQMDSLARNSQAEAENTLRNMRQRQSPELALLDQPDIKTEDIPSIFDGPVFKPISNNVFSPQGAFQALRKRR